MIQIENNAKFEGIVSDAIEAAIMNAHGEATARRWVNAINRAVIEIESNPLLDYDHVTHQLLICSPSNNIYSANGVCQCKAYELGQPCWHRAAARLVRLYVESQAALTVETVIIDRKQINKEIDNAPYITPRGRTADVKVEGYRL